MPQFDTLTFLSQLSWVFFCFLGLYIVLLRLVLPSLAISLKVRKKLARVDSSYAKDSAHESLLTVKIEPLLLKSILCCKKPLACQMQGPLALPESSIYDASNEHLLRSSCLASARLTTTNKLLLWTQFSGISAK
jgi:hypothetical protein